MAAITLTGFMGTGKTTVGRLLAARLGKPFIDVDARIEERTGLDIGEIFARHGEAFFREVEREELRAAVATDSVVATGGGAIVDPQNAQRMKASGPVICLTASVETILARTAAGQARPLLQHENRRQRVETLLAERAKAYALADCTIDTTGRSPEDVVASILAFLGTVAHLEGAPV